LPLDFVAVQKVDSPAQMLHPSGLPIEQLLADCEFRRTRRSGPGGQHRNKVETAVVIEHLPTGIRVEANERRSQEQNRQVAIHRLRMTLAIEFRTVAEPSVSALWRSRSTGGKLAVNPEHEDFPPLLAEALDAIVGVDFELATAAEQLGITSSQLIKFLKVKPAALTWVNSERRVRGSKPYH
jgi:hypothetical protein